MNQFVTANPYSQLSSSKRLLRTILSGMQRALPERTFAALYRPAFAVYRRRLLARYHSQMEFHRDRGDPNIVRMDRVYAVMPYSLIGASGLEHTDQRACQLLQQNVRGAFVECGVARGGSAALIAQIARLASPHRQCWFFDSFAGLPDPTSNDLDSGRTGDHIRPLPKGSCLGTLEQVAWLLFEQFGLSRDEITLVKGWFQDTLPTLRADVGPIALLRIDGDWYESTRCCLTQLYDQVSSGGAVVIDDYWSCHGARRATDEFLAERGLHVELMPDGRGGMSFIKPSREQTTESGS